MSDAASNPLRLLIVDDELDIKTLFEQRFRKDVRTGRVQFLFAHSGEDALKLVTDLPDPKAILILSDINMPGMTGLELLKKIKEHDPGSRVMMVTAYGDEATRSKAISYGAADFITKPIDFVELRKRIGLE